MISKLDRSMSSVPKSEASFSFPFAVADHSEIFSPLTKGTSTSKQSNSLPVMLKSSVMIGLLVLLAMTSLMAFTKNRRLIGSCGKVPMVSRSVLKSVNSPAIESIKRQMMVNRKPPPPTVILEERRISIVTVPSIREIEDAAKISERSIASKTFCTRSGGYPDLDVKDGIYLLLWASMTHNLHNTQLQSQNQAVE